MFGYVQCSILFPFLSFVVIEFYNCVQFLDFCHKIKKITNKKIFNLKQSLDKIDIYLYLDKQKIHQIRKYPCPGYPGEIRKILKKSKFKSVDNLTAHFSTLTRPILPLPSLVVIEFSDGSSSETAMAENAKTKNILNDVRIMFKLRLKTKLLQAPSI